MMYRYYIIYFGLLLSSCAPTIRVSDRYPNNQEKTVDVIKEEGDSFKLIKRINYYQDGKILSEVTFADKKMHGNFFQYHLNGQINVKGRYSYGEKIGKWTWRNVSGMIDSIHSYDRNLLNGWSKIFNNGELIIRQKYLNGKLNGKFTEYYPGGVLKVSGSYLDDIPNEQWIWKLEDKSNSRLINYKQGIKSGDFKIWNSGELTLSGAFEDDLQSGEWKWFRSGKKLDSLITFSKGLRDGLYEVYHQNGEQAIAGKYLNANREGRWEWWAEDASIDSIKTFSNGYLNGPLVIYSDNGEITRSANFRLDKLDGVESIYYVSGQLKEKTTYSAGEKMGNYEIWAPSGNMEEIGSYLSDQLHGQIKRWYSNGSPASLYTYKDGLLNGLMQVYSLSNILKRESYYKKGDEIARFEYHDNERFKRIMTIDDGLTLYERKWNYNGVEETNELFISGTRTDSDYFISGNIKYECIYKGTKKHGIEWWFDDQRNPTKINLYDNGRMIVSHNIEYETNE